MSLQKKIAGLMLSHLTWKDIKIYPPEADLCKALARRDFNKLLPC
jgi:hypothetical protein